MFKKISDFRIITKIFFALFIASLSSYSYNAIALEHEKPLVCANNKTVQENIKNLAFSTIRAFYFSAIFTGIYSYTNPHPTLTKRDYFFLGFNLACFFIGMDVGESIYANYVRNILIKPKIENEKPREVE